jgi:type II secretory pathway pseudopilin PulG
MRRQAGFTRLEFALVALIFAMLIGSFFYAVRQQQEQAEKLSVELNIMSMRTGLLSEIAERLINGKGEQAADLLGANPVRFLKGPPAGYIGEFKALDEGRLQPGSWYFDLTTGELVYLPNLAGGFRRQDGSEKKEIRWRIQPRSQMTPSALTVDALSLTAVTQFEWL